MFIFSSSYLNLLLSHTLLNSLSILHRRLLSLVYDSCYCRYSSSHGAVERMNTRDFKDEMGNDKHVEMAGIQRIETGLPSNNAHLTRIILLKLDIRYESVFMLFIFEHVDNHLSSESCLP
jgi:hypothetical protein